MKLTKTKLKEIIKEEIENILDEAEEGNVYAICTASIAKTAGTSERSKWSKADLARYEKCVKGVAKEPGMHK